MPGSATWARQLGEAAWETSEGIEPKETHIIEFVRFSESQRHQDCSSVKNPKFQVVSFHLIGSNGLKYPFKVRQPRVG